MCDYRSVIFQVFLVSVVGMRHVPYEQCTWDTFSIRVLSQNWMKGRFRETPHVSYGRSRWFLATVPQTQADLGRTLVIFGHFEVSFCVHFLWAIHHCWWSRGRGDRWPSPSAALQGRGLHHRSGCLGALWAPRYLGEPSGPAARGLEGWKGLRQPFSMSW